MDVPLQVDTFWMQSNSRWPPLGQHKMSVLQILSKKNLFNVNLRVLA